MMLNRVILYLVLFLVLISISASGRPDSSEEGVRILIAVDGINTYNFSMTLIQNMSAFNSSAAAINNSSLIALTTARGSFNLTSKSMSISWVVKDVTNREKNSIVKEMAFYLINDTFYSLADNRLTQVKVDDSSVFMDKMNLLSQMAQLHRAFPSEPAGSEVIDGHDCRRVRVKPDLESYLAVLFQQAGPLSLLAQRYAADINEKGYVEWISWIDKEGQILRKSDFKMRLNATPEDLGQPGYKDISYMMLDQESVTDITDINQPITINPPEWADHAELQEIGGADESSQKKWIIPGPAVTGDFVWTYENFSGLYYDKDNDIGTEKITANLTDGNKLSGDAPYGIKYETHAYERQFRFKDWGTYNAICLFGQKFFAGYGQNSINPMASKSTDRNMLTRGQVLEILTDDCTEMTISTGTPLMLANGYSLAVKSIDADGSKVYLQLKKDGRIIDENVVSYSKDNSTMNDTTYCYRRSAGNANGVALIAIHFKNVYRDGKISLATIDGEWQLSDTPLIISPETAYDNVTVQSVDAGSGKIAMANAGCPILLCRNCDIDLMPDFRISVADNDILMYRICKEVTEPGTYEVRGQIASGSFTWTPQNYAVPYYDRDKVTGSEKLTTAISEGNTLSGDQPFGIRYETEALNKKFKFRGWGEYRAIYLMGKGLFAGYIDDQRSPLAIETADDNMLSHDQLLGVLINDDDEVAFGEGTSHGMAEGYNLTIAGINDRRQVYLELYKDGEIVDDKVVSVSEDNASLADSTYCYKKWVLGGAEKVVTIAIHFKDVFMDHGQAFVLIDGEWQLSDVPLQLRAGAAFGRMTVASFDPAAMKIAMDNRHNTITLNRNSDIALIPGLSIHVAGGDDKDTLKYYPYTEWTQGNLAI